MRNAGDGWGDAWVDIWRRLIGRGNEAIVAAPSVAAPADDSELEQPWLGRWEHLPKRSAGHDFSRDDYRLARDRAKEVARTTLGDEAWAKLGRHGHLDLPSRLFDGITYRLRVGRRIEVIAARGVSMPWVYPFLCINPTYPLPELEFFAHLYLYVRDHEDEVLRVGAPQPWDQPLGRTF